MNGMRYVSALLMIVGPFSGLAIHAAVLWNDDFSAASVNANFTEYVQGAGAGSVQSAGRLELDSGSVSGSAQSALSTISDQSGTLTQTNGVPLYNLFDHPLSVRFDIDSIAGTPGGGNVFFFSIGDDAAGNYMPRAGLLDNGIGFAIEQVDAGAGPYWRIVYSALVGGVLQNENTVVANISGVPSSVTWVLGGTSGTILLEGATLTAMGSAGFGTVGDSHASVVLNDLSGSVSGYTLTFGAYNRGTVSEKTVVTLDAIKVDLIDGFDAGLFGAVPNDEQDDTIAIQTALDLAGGMPGTNTVHLPAGDYFVSTLYINGNTVLVGDGSSGTEVSRLRLNEYMPGGASIIKNKNRDRVVDRNIAFEKICFDGRGSVQTNGYIHSLNMQNVVGLKVDECRFENSSAIGCVVQGTQVENCLTEILNCSSSGNLLGFYVQSRDGLIDSLNGVLLSNCVSDADQWGFDVYLASNTTFVSCSASHASNGHNSGFTSDSCTDLHYIDCMAEGNDKRGFAVFINLNNLRQPCGISFSNCVSCGNGQNGFEIANASNVTLNNVQSYENGEYGIVALSSFRYDRLSTGLLVENSTIVSNGLEGIELRGIQDSQIRSNAIHDNALDLNADSSGIKIRNGTYWVPDMPSFNILIRDNAIDGAEQAYGVHSIDLSDQVALLNNELAGNRIAPYLLAGSANTVIPPVRYSDWNAQWGAELGASTNDYDGDGIDNFTEYVVGGDPTNSLDTGTQPVFTAADGVMSYVYVKRANDSSLAYALESTTHLLNPDWQPSGYVALPDVWDGNEFYVVTNRVETSHESLFLRLRIE